MNNHSGQFRSKADREREAAMCSQFGAVKMPAIQAANAVKAAISKNNDMMTNTGPLATYKYWL